ncbi:MAG: carbon starvation protein A [Ichthyobacteriaceae bacterium]|nr:carbon starvation protein A [Ichthyobacteriaceae bacterium]
MYIFFLAILALVLGYYIYGTFVDRVFGPKSDKETPAITKHDGIDFIVMPTWKVFLVQLLNIAGVGPIFGPILGALYGPSALIWIVIGSIFGGAVHDYFSGMLSIRDGGSSIPEIIGSNLGKTMKIIMRGFSVVLLLLVGIVFVSAPAQMLSNITDWGMPIYVGIFFVYYFIATILPVDKIIGKIYPVFGVALVFMAIALMVMLVVKGYEFYPQLTIDNINPQGLPMWPLMFITIACGAISGFHATQSPMMARTINNEKNGRAVFYGSMIMEGVIALIWATLAMSFFHNSEELNELLSTAGPAGVVNKISTTLLGPIGGVLAVVSVVFLPVSSGDTAFRSARLIIADFMKVDQKSTAKRLLIAIPLFIVGFIVSKTDFGMIWRYFGWANQTLAMTVLWTIAVYLRKQNKLHWIATIPALFMTAVVISFMFYSEIGFGLSIEISTIVGVVGTLAIFILFLFKMKKYKKDGQQVIK